MSLQPGDVGWANQSGFVPWWIKWCQARKYHHSPASQFNHVYMVTSWQGGLIQANGSGMGAGNVSDYAGQNVVYRRPPYVAPGRNVAVQAMGELLRNHDHYGWWTIFSVALTLLTGTRFRFGVANCLICSGAVSYALTRANIDVGDDSDWNSPADLAEYAIAGNWPVIPC